MEPKRIIVACGTGGVTSRNIAMKLEKYLRERHVPCSIDTCKVIEVREKARALHPDLIASPTSLPDDLPVPTITATALLTGIGAEKVYQQVYDMLTK